LINEVDRFGGSVIAFAGDAITCWFEGDDGRKATSCALAMQAAIAPLSQVKLPDGGTVVLAMKAAAASGPARRFLVGQSDIQLIDVLAGRTLARMAAGAHLAAKGEVALDLDAASRLGAGIDIAAWRVDQESGEQFAIVSGLHGAVETAPPPDSAALEEAAVRPWLIPAVYQRLRAGKGEFLTELRPAVAMFIKFDGIDYDRDEGAGAKLNAFVSRVQRILARYEGFLIDVSIGDKGSYLYCCFGAPIAHENDISRALAVAFELRAPVRELGFIARVQMGISCGTMRAGAYGGATRRTYGVLGDEVNLAARLMEHAAPGQVLVSGSARNAGGEAFGWEPCRPSGSKARRRRSPFSPCSMPAPRPHCG